MCSALNSSTLTMKRDCGEQKSGYYGTATLIEVTLKTCYPEQMYIVPAVPVLSWLMITTCWAGVTTF